MIFTLCLKATLPQYNPTDGVNEKLLPTFTMPQVRVVALERCWVQTLVGTRAMVFHMVFLSFSMGICWN
jgi:hypothetical protein